MTIYLTQEYLKEILDYDLESGILVWKRREEKRNYDKTLNSKLAGKRAGCIEKDGYRQIRLDKQYYREHRIIWFWMTGSWPKDQIDHKNGIRDDNRWNNLREATPYENQQNRISRKQSISKYIGVYYQKGTNKFQAKICINNKRIFLGYYDTAEEALKAYSEAKSQYHQFQPTIRS